MRVSAIIARERVIAETLPVELCEDGTWKRDGSRARSLQREAIAPLFFTPEPPKDPTDAGADALAADWAAQLGAWLRTHYLISYEPPPGGGWHPVSVQVKRRGVTVTARPGYVVQ